MRKNKTYGSSYLYGIEIVNEETFEFCESRSNRTFMELKWLSALTYGQRWYRSNRTFMELK